MTDVIEELARASGIDPIVVDRGAWAALGAEEIHAEMWLGGRMVRVEVRAGLTMTEARQPKSITVHGGRYDFAGAVETLRAYLAGEIVDGDSYLVEPEAEICVDVDDLRELLDLASDEMRERYAHALDQRR